MAYLIIYVFRRWQKVSQHSQPQGHGKRTNVKIQPRTYIGMTASVYTADGVPCTNAYNIWVHVPQCIVHAYHHIIITPHVLTLNRRAHNILLLLLLSCVRRTPGLFKNRRKYSYADKSKPNVYKYVHNVQIHTLSIFKTYSRVGYLYVCITARTYGRIVFLYPHIRITVHEFAQMYERV